MCTVIHTIAYRPVAADASVEQWRYQRVQVHGSNLSTNVMTIQGIRGNISIQKNLFDSWMCSTWWVMSKIDEGRRVWDERCVLGNSSLYLPSLFHPLPPLSSLHPSIPPSLTPPALFPSNTLHHVSDGPISSGDFPCWRGAILLEGGAFRQVVDSKITIVVFMSIDG